MAPIIDVSDEVLGHLDGLGVPYKLAEQTETQPAITQSHSTMNYEPDPSDYIVVPGIRSRKEKRPNLWVCKYRLGMSPKVEQAGRQIGLTLENTARENTNGREYVGNINKEQAVRLNLLLGGRTSDIRLARDFLRLLFSGKAKDGIGNLVPKKELLAILDEITKVKYPWRAEWYEDSFTQGSKGLVLEKHYSLENNVLVPQYSHELTSCLMEDKTPGIDLQSWLRTSTAQGLPKKSVESGKLGYWYPRANSASGFLADPDIASFYCYGDPLDSGSWLGVRHVREAHALKK